MGSDEDKKVENEETPNLLNHDDGTGEEETTPEEKIKDEISHIETKPLVDITAPESDDSEELDDDLLPGARTPAESLVEAKVEETPEEEEEEVAEEKAPKMRRSKPASNTKELLLEDLPSRVSYANERLRSQLTGKILISVTDKKESYLFDWSGDKLKIEKGGDEKKAECKISISEVNLLRISRDELNPQVAMLSEKINVEGTASLALYFFNLITPN